MKSLIILSLKYLKRQKLRTVLTLISIILGMFIISLSLLFSTSAYKSIKDMIKNESGIYEINIGSALPEDETVFEKVLSLDKHYLTENLYAENYFSFIPENENIVISCDKGGKIVPENVLLVSYYEKQNNNNSFSNDDLCLNSNNSGFKCINNSNGIILPEDFKNMGYSENDHITLKFSSSDNQKSFVSENYIIEGFEGRE